MSNSIDTSSAFGPLEAVQLVKLAIEVSAQPKNEMETQIATTLGYKVEPKDQNRVLLVSVTIDAVALVEQTPSVKANCHIVGAWQILHENVTEDMVKSFSERTAFHLMYALAKQNMADLAGKAGLLASKWPWHPIMQATAESTLRKSTKKSQKRKTPGRR